jgi:hypothetical protein
LKCNYDTRNLPIYLPDFYKECLEAWSLIKRNDPTSVREIIEQSLWNNRFILIDKKSVFNQCLFYKGIVKVGDLLSVEKSFLRSENNLRANISPVQYFILVSLVHALPAKWKRMIKAHPYTTPSVLDESIRVFLGDKSVDILNQSYVKDMLNQRIFTSFLFQKNK